VGGANKGKEKAARWGASEITLLTKYRPDNKLKQKKMGGAYGTYAREGSRMQGFGREAGRKETTLKTCV
jgi:hypothetical protein